MTETSTEPKRIPIPKDVTDREFWLDCFQTFAASIIDKVIEDRAVDYLDSPHQSLALNDGVKLAASLADTALEEALFRQWVTAGAKRKKRTVKVSARKRK